MAIVYRAQGPWKFPSNFPPKNLFRKNAHFDVSSKQDKQLHRRRVKRATTRKKSRSEKFSQRKIEVDVKQGFHINCFLSLSFQVKDSHFRRYYSCTWAPTVSFAFSCGHRISWVCLCVFVNFACGKSRIHFGKKAYFITANDV